MRVAQAAATVSSSSSRILPMSMQTIETSTKISRRKRRITKSLSRICSLQEVGLTPPEQRRFRRIHGLQLPLHPQQLLGWFVLIIVLTGTFVCQIPALTLQLRIPILAIIISIFVIHLIAHLTALLLDPAELAVRQQPRDKIVPEFDRTRHLHVIENGRCHLCNIDATSTRTKHCSVCNKCVAKFDHHCKWLNNCIGKRNYVAFIVCLVSIIFLALIVLALSVAELSLVRFESKLLSSSNDTIINMDNVTLPLSLPLPATGSLIVISIVGILSAIAAILLIHLCFFHGYIACLGVTTYEYVRNKHNRQPINNAIARNNQRNDIDNNIAASNCFKRPSFCQPRRRSDDEDDNDNRDRDDVRYHFCETVNTDEANRADSRNIYFCSSHTSSTTTAQISQQSNGGGASTTVIQRTNMAKERRNFHLYFSYDSKFNETSIELSQTVLNGDNQQQQHQQQQQSIQRFDRMPLEMKPSTPSPVSCCFSIMGHPSSTSSSLEKAKQRKLRQAEQLTATDEKPLANRSCTTMRRIQTFLRTRLRKHARQRAINSESACSARKNKVNPLTPEAKFEEASVEPIRCISNSGMMIDEPPILPPVKLPPLTLPPRHSILVDNKRPLRVRRTPLGHKRPRFKVGPHLAQSAQLSPIPESELSKPASPKSPKPIGNRFTFPPLTSA